jgi:MFS family permease
MTLSADQVADVRAGRGKFVAMAAAYSLGAFNDNFYRMAAMQLAVAAGMAYLQNVMMVLFALPFVLAAAPAGWLADRFAKRRVVIASKAMELAAMSLGAAGLVYGSWALVLAMVLTIGLQAAMFSPALNGSIPELYPAWYVPAANGVLKAVVTAAILLGAMSAGLVVHWRGPAAVAVGALVVAGAGLAASLGVPRRAAAMPAAPFPWTGPVQTVRVLGGAWADRLLGGTILADAFVWFLGACQLQLINVLAIGELGGTERDASVLAAAELAGVAVGGVVAGRAIQVGQIARSVPGDHSSGELCRRAWQRVLAPAALATGAALAAVPAAAALPEGLRYAALCAAFFAAGAGGGVLMIPCESFIQVRPAAQRRGSVIAAANALAFLGILLSGPTAWVLGALAAPSTSVGVLGAVAIAVAWLIRRWEKRSPNGPGPARAPVTPS